MVDAYTDYAVVCLDFENIVGDQNGLNYRILGMVLGTEKESQKSKMEETVCTLFEKV